MFKSRVAIAIIGAVLIGGLSGVVAGVKIMPWGANTTIAQGVTTRPGSDISPTTPADTLTAIPTKRSATVTPLPTASSTPAPGQSADLRGHIGTIDNAHQSFDFTASSSSAITVVVTGATHYQNVSGFSALKSGMRAEIKGVYQTSTTLVATVVNVSVDN